MMRVSFLMTSHPFLPFLSQILSQKGCFSEFSFYRWVLDLLITKSNANLNRLEGTVENVKALV